MAATFRAGETTVNDGGTLTKTTDVPSGTTENDILIFLSHMHDGGGTEIVWPGGVTEIVQDTDPVNTDFTAGAAFRVATDSEPSDYTVTQGNANSGTDQFFAIAAVQGADTSAPIADAAIQWYDEGQGSANVYAPSVEGVEGGLLIVAWLHKYENAGLGSITPPGGMTLGGQGQTSLSATPTPGYSIGAWAWEELTADGPTGMRTATTSKTVGDYVQFGISIVIAPSGDPVPTADAGPNQTVAQGAQNVQMAGTASGGAGGPYTHIWRIISDTTGGASLDDDDIEDPTLDMGPAAGVVVLGYRVEDSEETPSAEDTVTITSVGAGAISVPVTDGTLTGWARVPTGGSLASALGDSTTATYIVYVDPDGTVSGWVGMSEWVRTPGLGGTVQIQPSMIGASGSINVELREGSSTVIKAWGPLAWSVGTLVQNFLLTLSAGEADAIVDPTALRVYFSGQVTS